jgi:hypothetical protein
MNGSTPQRLYCYSCDHTRTDRCNLARAHWPRVGDRCASFEFEPGTGPTEFDSYDDYQRTALAMENRT